MLVFIKIGGTGGLTFFMPFLMFIFLLALGEDYNILVMSRIREEAHSLPLREADHEGAEHDRHHGHVGRPDPGRHVRGVRGGQWRQPGARSGTSASASRSAS